MGNDEPIKLPVSLANEVTGQLHNLYRINKWKECCNCEFKFGELTEEDLEKLKDFTFTKEELGKIWKLNFTDASAGDLEGIEKWFPNLRVLSVESRSDDAYRAPRNVKSIGDKDVYSIEKCKSLEDLTIANQAHIIDIDLSRLPKLHAVNIRNNANLKVILGIDKLSELDSLACYGNKGLEEIKNLDKAIVQSKEKLKRINLDVLLFPKAIGYNHLNGTYNQEAMDAIEYINGGVRMGSSRVKTDDKVTWTESLTISKNITISTHSMLKMHNKACQILHEILPEYFSTFDTVVAVERYLAENVTYAEDACNHSSRTLGGYTAPGRPGNVRMMISYENGINGAYDCLMHNECVCQGYTRGEQYLLGLKGIKTSEVHCIGEKDTLGLADKENANSEYFNFSLPEDGYHNIIRIDDYYSLYSDPCWNATHYQRGDKSMPYTLLTKEEIRKDHTLSFQEVSINNNTLKRDRSQIEQSLEKSIRHNALFKNTQASDVKAQRAALQQDVMGIVRGANGRTYE